MAKSSSEKSGTNKTDKTKTTGPTISFEAKLFLAADKLRKNLEPSDYKHVVLGLIFLRHISQSFEAKRAELEKTDPAAAEDPDEYLAENIFWVPKEARWSYLQAKAPLPEIGKFIDDAMIAIEEHNSSLKGVLPKGYNSPSLDKVMVGELVNLISDIALGLEGATARDLLGRVYEYFLGGFAGAEGKRGGEFYTPRSVVQVLVEMLEPFPDKARGIEGRVYDPCCGSGGMFVQAEKFLETHGGRIGQLAIYGQESNYTTWRLCKMNLAVRGIDASGIAWNNEGSFQKDEWRDKKFDFILANPPFNTSDWAGDKLREDVRWQYGVPPIGNANYAWLQHILWHLAPNGTAGVVLANGSMSSGQSGEDVIRRAMVEGDVVDCMIALPGQLFYSTQIPVCLWFLARNKNDGQLRDRRGEILFIDARKLGQMVDRTRKEFVPDDIARIANTYHAWRGEPKAGTYQDQPGFCFAATRQTVESHNFVLTPGRYVGSEEVEADTEPFAEKFARLNAELEQHFAESDKLTAAIRDNLKRLVGG